MLKKIFFLFLFATGSLSAQHQTYTVDLNSTQTHKVGVSVEVEKCGAKIVTYQMPIWAPGAYSVTHYGHYVSDFKAFDSKGKSLKINQVNGDRWEIADAKNIQRITYSVNDSHKDSTSLFFALCNIDTNFFFANGTCLFGYVNDKKDIPSLVEYHFPHGWKLGTALESRPDEKFYDAAHPDFLLTSFAAKNYDELADAPVMAGTGFQTRTFKDGKAWYDIVLASDKPFPMDSLEENTHKIVHAETEFFHDTPFDHYTFLIYAPTYSKLFSSGEGALEHSNSSAYLLVNLPWNTFKQFGPAIISHEFFHLWNVKRIHSSLLGPFDYTKRVMTTSLWLSEGITDYYAHTILTRWNILPYRSFESMVGDLTNSVKSSKAANTKTLEELSIAESDFDLMNALVFYSKGTLVGLMLDIEIRSRTDNKKSLDDVMLALNAEAKKGKTFKDKELIGKVEKITGLDLQNFYKKYIAGTDALPIDEYLRKMGMGDTLSIKKGTAEKYSVAHNFLGDVLPTQHKESPSNKTKFVFYRAPSAGKMENPRTEESGSEFVGIQQSDTLISVNGESFTIDKFHEIGKSFSPPVTYDLEVKNSFGKKHVTISYFDKKDKATVTSEDHISHLTYKYVRLPDATPLEVAIRHGIVGKDY